MIQYFFIHIILIILIILFFLILLYIYPVFVRYNLKFFHYFKQPFLIALAQPLETFGMISWVVFIVSIFFHIPIVFIFSGSTLLAYPISWLAPHPFKKIEAKKVFVVWCGAMNWFNRFKSLLLYKYILSYLMIFLLPFLSRISCLS